MATLTAIRAGLVANLATLADVQVSAYMLANPSPPTLQVMGPDSAAYDQSMRGSLTDWHMIVQGFCCNVADIGGQVNLDAWLAPAGALSVKAALESDRTLAGVAQDSTVVDCSGYRVYQLDSSTKVLGAEWTVWVRTLG